MDRLLLILACIFGTLQSVRSQTDSLCADSVVMVEEKVCVKEKGTYSFRPARFVIPAAVLGYGIWANGNDWMDGFNRGTRDEIVHHIDRHTSIDDFSQYASVATMYALDVCKVKAKHGAVDQTIILGLAELLQATTTTVMKNIWGTRRPDFSTNNSFPSGHTATAFMGAHMLAREYWHKSPFIGMAGYAVAAGTGYFRMYNNRHWFNDVVTGAAIGVLSVETAYCLYPWVTRHVFKKRRKHNVLLAPYVSISEKSAGLTIGCR